MALKVPEARTQCRTIIVFTTPVGFSERYTHLVLWLTYKETRIWFRFRRKKAFSQNDRWGPAKARPQLPHMTSRHWWRHNPWHTSAVACSLWLLIVVNRIRVLTWLRGAKLPNPIWQFLSHFRGSRVMWKLWTYYITRHLLTNIAVITRTQVRRILHSQRACVSPGAGLPITPISATTAWLYSWWYLYTADRPSVSDRPWRRQTAAVACDTVWRCVTLWRWFRS